MDRASVMRWVDGYERAWRDGDLDAVETLFTGDVRYRTSPYEPPLVGLDAVRGCWLDDEGRTFTMAAAPIAVEGDVAVVRVEVHYADPRPQEYRDLWVLHFARDGRVDDFEEWAYCPGRPYTAPAADGD